jgi:hypothetical protein
VARCSTVSGRIDSPPLAAAARATGARLSAWAITAPVATAPTATTAAPATRRLLANSTFRFSFVLL